MAKVIEGLFYSESHEYVKVEGDFAYVGITDYAQHALGNVVYVDMPEVDDEVEADEDFGAVESVKAASDLTPKVVGNIARLRTTAKPAPALTPIMFGEARGLPRTACITAPDTASAAPARKPPSTRGSLTQ